jgi:hypothetical protein
MDPTGFFTEHFYRKAICFATFVSPIGEKFWGYRVGRQVNELQGFYLRVAILNARLANSV